MKFRRSATMHASNFTSQCVSSFPFLSLASFFFPHGGFFLSCQVHLWAHFLSLFSAVTCGGPRVGPQTKHMPTPPGTMSRGRRHGVGLVVYSSLGSTSLRAWELVVHRSFPGLHSSRATTCPVSSSRYTIIHCYTYTHRIVVWCDCAGKCPAQ